jgi:hypothetical protein
MSSTITHGVNYFKPLIVLSLGYMASAQLVFNIIKPTSQLDSNELTAYFFIIPLTLVSSAIYGAIDAYNYYRNNQ